MSRGSNKDFYLILGVEAGASADEIRAAYMARARILHPDRFDQKGQPQDWKNANDMMAELNEAYAVLRSTASRAEYDRSRGGGQQRQETPPPRPESHAPPPPPEPEPQPSPAYESGEYGAGYASFGSLPKEIQAHLLRRQTNVGTNQFQVKLKSIAWNFLFIALLACWFWYLFGTASGVRWTGETLGWYCGITVAAGIMMGLNLVTIRRWMRASLKPYFYVTPLYFIKTEYDIVSFRPIWTLKDVTVNHHHKNGSYRNSEVIFQFDGHDEPLSLSSKVGVEIMFKCLQQFDARLRAAFADNDTDYIHKNDDFFGVPRTGVPSVNLLPWWRRGLIHAVALVLCGAGFAAAVAVNEKADAERWTNYPTQSTHAQAPTSTQAERFVTAEEMLKREREAAKPAALQRVTPPSHPTQALPKSGSYTIFTKAKRIAPFTIITAQGGYYYVKLVDVRTRAQAMTVFVWGGSPVNVDVPLGTYEVRYASGDTWYGDKYLFGPDTACSKADETFTFEHKGDQVTGFTITLYQVRNGNLSTSTMRPEDF